MSDIAFQCHACTKNLAISDRFMGMVFPCPDCQTELRAPDPTFVFPCPECGLMLFSDEALRGKVYGCPGCETLFEVPMFATVCCAQCGVHLDMDDESYQQMAGTHVECPQCGADVELPALPKLEVPAAMAPPPQPEGPPPITVTCRFCSQEVELRPQVYAAKAGKMIQCPHCHRYFLVPKNKPGEDGESPTAREAQPMKTVEDTAGKFSKTMRMDSILENIPQARSIQEGYCLYCLAPVKQIDEHTFVCEKCWRVIRTVKKQHR